LNKHQKLMSFYLKYTYHQPLKKMIQANNKLMLALFSTLYNYYLYFTCTGTVDYAI
jgi:hypothetical protein